VGLSIPSPETNETMTTDSLASAAKESRDGFLALVDHLRPELHRYCARMTGSIIDGEDVVQDTLARAYFALPELEQLPPLRAWLFRIAHNRALDFRRRYDQRMSDDTAVIEEVPDDGVLPDDRLAREEAIRAAVSRFIELVPLQRSCVVLKDVLGHSAEEIATLLDLSVPAVRAALHRGRARLSELSNKPEARAPLPERGSPTVARYAALFNAQDWDGVRAMLAEEVRLDLVSRMQRSGRRGVEKYFTNYGTMQGCRVAPMWLEGREVLGLYRRESDDRPHHVIVLDTGGGRVTGIRDYLYIEYLLSEARLSSAG
jgi:RNA polymerase sigma-70 factor (ECF subfamily)